MSKMRIRTYPDPALRQKAQAVTKLDKKILKFIDDLEETMYAAPACIGLAATQVAVPLRVVIVDVSPKEKGRNRRVLINPEIVDGKGRKVVREGCMSVPDYTGNVERYEKIRVKTLNTDGNQEFFSTNGLEAVCIQHEIDHLDGIIFLDRVTSLKTDVFRRKRYK